MRGLIFKTIAATLISATATIAASETLRIGSDTSYPPYTFLNDSGEIEGFEADMVSELCTRLEVECVWVTTDFDAVISGLVSGNTDLIVSAMSITDERDKIIDFSIPYLKPERSAYVAARGAGDDVVNGVVAAQVGTIFAAHVVGTDATLAEFQTSDDSLAALRNGEVDAVFDYASRLMPIIEESGEELAFVGPDVFLGKGVGIGLREGSAELKGRIDAAITQMIDDGTLNTLIKEWLSADRKF